MAKWREVAISELALGGKEGVAGGPFGSSLGRKHYTVQGVPVIRGAQLSGDGRFSLDDLVFVSAEKADRHTGNLAYPGDVIVTQRGTLGQVGLIPQGKVFDRFLLSQSQMKITVDPSVGDAEFVYFALRAPEANQRLIDHATTSGVPHINLDTLRKLRLSLPDLDTQRRIATLLSAIDKLIAINDRRIETLEDLARSLYREWFVHFRFPGHKDVGFVDSELGPIPGGWEARHLSDVVTTQYGLTTSASKETVGPKLLRGMDINKRSFVNWEEVPFCSTEEDDVEKFGLDVGDVLVVRMADPGKVGIVERPVEAVFASYLVRFRSANPSVPPYLLFHFLDSPRYQTWIRGSSTGSTRKSASAAVLTEPVMAIPPSDIATRFESKVGPLRSALTSLVEQSAVLRRTRDLLLPRLVTGKVDISDIDLGVLTPSEAA